MTAILAIDTSADACSVALNIDGEITSLYECAPRAHTQLILPMVDEVLAKKGLTLSQLDALAFGRGPGAFTGLRIATGIVQGLAYGADLPVIPVSTLAALAMYAIEQTQAEIALCAVDARMSEVYWAAYQSGTSGVVLLGDEVVCAPALLKISGQLKVPEALKGSIVAVGSGWNFQAEMPDAIASAPQHIMADVLPDARYVAQLALPMWQDGKAVSAEQALPVYLRDTVTWKKLPGRE